MGLESLDSETVAAGTADAAVGENLSRLLENKSTSVGLTFRKSKRRSREGRFLEADAETGVVRERGVADDDVDDDGERPLPDPCGKVSEMAASDGLPSCPPLCATVIIEDGFTIPRRCSDESKLVPCALLELGSGMLGQLELLCGMACKYE